MEARLALSSLGVGTASMGSLTTSKWLGALTIEPESNEYFELILDTFQNGFFFFTLTWMKIAKRKKVVRRPTPNATALLQHYCATFFLTRTGNHMVH